MSPYSIKMPHWSNSFGTPSGTPSERARKLLSKLGNPEKKLPPVIHVGGTKGKGSTIAFLRAIMEASGYKVHTYTSPHIEKFNERIVLAGQEISDAYLYEIMEATRKAADDMEVGFFDATTAGAMLAFSQQKADILLMEMGLGGTVDATNIVDNPLMTILTTISYDHTEYMGDTLPEIAAFEAGIFKQNVPCIVSYQHEQVLPVLENIASQKNAPLYVYGKNWLVKKMPNNMIFSDSYGEAILPLPALLGVHQIANAGNAIAAITALEDFNISQEDIFHGLLNAKWKGRLQKINSKILPEPNELWFDGGHNLAAAQAISLFAEQNWNDCPFYLIFGTTIGKDVISMLTPFIHLAKEIYSVSVKSETKSYDAEKIADIASFITNVTPYNSIKDALQDIVEKQSKPFRVLIFGSLYLWLEAIDS